MSFRSSPVLVVANSARLLTKLLADNAYNVIAIDCYGDTDTQAAAVANYCIDNLEDSGFFDLLLSVREHYSIQYAFYGSGFEHYETSLVFLEQLFTVIGNESEVISRLQNKPAFFDILQQHLLPFPSVCFGENATKHSGLIKPYKSIGGRDIFFSSKAGLRSHSTYWQAHVEGIPCSVLFIANGSEQRIIGFNKQLYKEIDGQPFVFSGLIAQFQLSATIRHKIRQYLAVLVLDYSLKGLCSLDFIVNSDEVYLLEINPRVPASAQLYGPELIGWHIQACLEGVLPMRIPSFKERALQVIYSECVLSITENINWPDGVVDTPSIGSLISKNQPICSIIIEYEGSDDVVALLQHREQIVKNLLLSG